MDWTENQQCVLCDKSGGNLLVCNDDGCPISVHKDCMGCEPHFDDVGNFRCPYCVYKHYTAEASRLRSKVLLTKKALSTLLDVEKRDDSHQERVVEMADKEDDISSNVTAEASRLRSKVMLTKKALSTFLDAEKRDDSHQEPVVEMADKEDDIVLNDELADENNGANLKNRDEIHDTSAPEKTNEVLNHNEGVHEVNNVNTCRMMVVYKPDSDHASKRMKVDQQTGNGACKFKVVDQAKQSKRADVWLTIDEQITSKKRNKSVTFKMNRRKEDFVMEHGAKKESEQPSVIDRSKRGRVLWSEQEEEMLKEGVQKYSVFTKKNLPWKKILEFGRHVFDSSRTPSDLKDKWRKMAK